MIRESYQSKEKTGAEWPPFDLLEELPRRCSASLEDQKLSLTPRRMVWGVWYVVG